MGWMGMVESRCVCERDEGGEGTHNLLLVRLPESLLTLEPAALVVNHPLTLVLGAAEHVLGLLLRGNGIPSLGLVLVQVPLPVHALVVELPLEHLDGVNLLLLGVANLLQLGVHCTLPLKRPELFRLELLQARLSGGAVVAALGKLFLGAGQLIGKNAKAFPGWRGSGFSPRVQAMGNQVDTHTHAHFLWYVGVEKLGFPC